MTPESAANESARPVSTVCCTAADLRLQWSSAHGRRVEFPEVLDMFRQRVERTLRQLEYALAIEAQSQMRASLADEIEKVQTLANEIRHMDARDSQLRAQQSATGPSSDMKPHQVQSRRTTS